MAEDLLVSGAGEMLNKLITFAFHETSLVLGTKEEVEKLRNDLTGIQAVLQDAEKQQLEKEAVKLWLKGLKEVAYYADDVLDEIAYEEALRCKLETFNNKVRNFFSLSNPLVFRIKIAHKIKDISAKLGEIKEQFKFNEVNLVTSVWTSAIETASLFDDSEIIGRKDDELKIINMLILPNNMDDNVVSVIPIVGLGGLGKTTLAQLVFNAKEVENHFDPRMWIFVSRDFNIKRLFTEMMEFTSETKHELSNMDLIQRGVQEKLREKRFLLVLDDMWKEEDFSDKWDQLRIVLTCAKQGSKIIVTTRSNEVASIVGTFPTHNLQILPEHDCWDLFERRVFGIRGVKKTHTLEAIGREIVRKCGGVPLAIKILGGMMRLKREENAWLAIKNNKIWNIHDADKKIMNVLKLSYVNLPSPVKQCFSYCSIFPKGCKIGKKMLIQLWMGEGFLGNTGMLEDIGNQYFNMLYSNSLFQNVQNNIFGEIMRCEMHDLVHDLAQFVSGKECSIVDANMIPKNVSEIRYMGYISGSTRTFPKALYEMRKLRTFVSYNLYQAGKVVPKDMFLKLKLLRVLDLSFTGIKELPSSICKLKHLRYLDLSMTDIEEIPKSITRLYNLQTLRLKKCKKLKALPQILGKLVNLRHLHIDAVGEWSKMPKGIGRLTCLQTLSVFQVGIEEDGNSITELKRLNLLGGKLGICRLENVRNATYAKIANLKEKNNISSLHLEWNRVDDGHVSVNDDDLSVLESLEPSSNLKRLVIEGFGGARMPTWITSGPILSSLVEITLLSCSRCECLPSFGQLPSLKTLEIEEMRNVKCFGDRCSSKLKEIDGPEVAFVAFPSLEKLVLKGMPNLEEWLLEEPMWSSPSSSFRCLEKLSIEECPKLKVTPPSLFPSLKLLLFGGPSSSMGVRSITTNLTFLTLLYIEGCSDLKFLSKRLLEQNRLLNSLAIVDCPEFEGFLEIDEVKHGNSLAIVDFPEFEGFPEIDEGRHGNEEDENASATASLRSEELSISSLPKGSGMLTNLESLEIWGCPNFRYITTNTTISLPSLKWLIIGDSNATVVELLTRNLTSLTHLALDKIQNLSFLPRNLLHNNMFLEKLLILNCSFLQGGGNFFCEKTIAEEELPLLSCLKLLVVGSCHALNSINLPSPCLPSLRVVHIEDCKGLKSFPDGLPLLPHLEFLRIGPFFEDLDYFPFPDIDQPQIQISAHHQYHFASLERLILIGWPKLTSLPHQPQHLTKLKGLCIEGFSGLVALPDWLGSLVSLEDLLIISCENLIHLPSKEVMLRLTSLKYFELKNCPFLKGRCNKDRGIEEWRKISHISVIQIDDDVVQDLS